MPGCGSGGLVSLPDEQLRATALTHRLGGGDGGIMVDASGGDTPRQTGRGPRCRTVGHDGISAAQRRDDQEQS